MAVSVNGQTVATYNADDQLTSYNGVPYSYAADGSLAGAGSTTYQYDALGHLLAVKTPTETITYTYDGLGRRVGKSVNGTLVQGFLYADGLHPIAELDGQGNVVATFVYGTRPNVPDLMLKGGVTYRILSDPLGSPVEVIDTATGAVVEQITYDAWGNITRDSNPGFQPFGFAGGLYDADTGLVHFGALDYDPAIGRWTTRDPLGFAGGDTNLYGYVLQDPVNAIDLSGHFLIEAAVGGVLGAIWGGASGYIEGDRGSALWRDIAVDGATGALIGLTDGASLLESEALNAAAGAALQTGIAGAGEAGRQFLNCGKVTSWGDVAASAAIGGVGGDALGATADSLLGQGVAEQSVAARIARASVTDMTTDGGSALATQQIDQAAQQEQESEQWNATIQNL